MNRLREALEAVMRDANDPHLAGLQKTTIALVQAALAGIEPQPMEKAPKDGTQILAYGAYQWEDYDDMAKTGYAVIFWQDEEKKWKLANANPYSDFMQPTWWMPLPPKQKIIDTTQKN